MHLRTLFKVLVVALVVAVPAAASAGPIEFTSTSSYHVSTRIGPVGAPTAFDVTSDTGNGSFWWPPYTWATDFSMGADQDGNYAEAGVVLFFNGGLTAGELLSVGVERYTTADGSWWSGYDAPLSLSLWVDTGGDGQFFSFAVGAYGQRTFNGYNGDTIANLGTIAYQPNATFTMPPLPFASNTPAALWIGVTNEAPGQAGLKTVTVTTGPAAVPDGGATLLLLGMAFTGLGVIRRRIS
jgi:hypothetical protein